MPANYFKVSIRKYPSLKLVGVSVPTDMSKAAADCPNLWEKVFVPRMGEISGKASGEFQGPSYGLSVCTDPESGAFTYWAALPVPDGLVLPKDMNIVEVPAGTYAYCHVPSLNKLASAYRTMYTVWGPSSREYALNLQVPCFEVYDKAFHESGELGLYIPVTAKPTS